MLLPNKRLQQTPQTLCGWLPCCFATAASVICGAAEARIRYASHGPSMCNLTQHRLAAMLAWCLIGACRAPANPNASTAAAIPIDVVVTFGEGPTERMFALRAPARMSIANAAFAPIPLSASVVRIGAYAALDQAVPALLWIAQVRPGSSARISLSALLLSGRRASAQFADDTVAAVSVEQACASEGWIAGFFVDGIGARPAGPVMLLYESDGKKQRIEIRPNEHTLPGSLALRILPRNIDGLTSVSSIGYQVSGASPPALPVLAWHDYKGWHAEGGSAPSRHYGWSPSGNMHEVVAPTHEWRLYLLSLPPACERWYGVP